MALALVPAAGAVRCFLTGWVVASTLRLLRLPPRPFLGALCTKPTALGGALAGFCLTFHGVRLVLERFGLPCLALRREATAGGTAAVALAVCCADVAGPQTELHASVVLTALRTAIPPSVYVGETARRHAGSHATALLPTALACGASWALLYVQAGSSVASVGASWEQISATFLHEVRGLAAAHLRATAPMSVALAAPSLGRSLRQPRGTVDGAHVSEKAYASPRALRLVAQLAGHLLREALALGAFAAAFSTLARCECRRSGWVAGLALVPLPASRQVDMALRLGYRAAGHASRLLLRRALSSYHGAWLAGAHSALHSAGDAAVLGLSAARLLALHAQAAAGEPTPLGGRSARIIHFLLGYNEEDGGDNGSNGTRANTLVEDDRTHGEG